MLSSSLERTLQAALALASAQRHEYATLEQLLLALLDDADAQMALRACHADLEGLRTGLTGFIECSMAQVATLGAVLVDQPGLRFGPQHI